MEQSPEPRPIQDTLFDVSAYIVACTVDNTVQLITDDELADPRSIARDGEW